MDCENAFAHRDHKADSSATNGEVCVCVSAGSANLLLIWETVFSELLKSENVDTNRLIICSASINLSWIFQLFCDVLIFMFFVISFQSSPVLGELVDKRHF